jgi:hypothetical protein
MKTLVGRFLKHIAGIDKSVADNLAITSTKRNAEMPYDTNGVLSLEAVLIKRFSLGLCLLVVVLVSILSSCNKNDSPAMSGGTVEIAIGDSIPNLIPQLGWSETGLIDRSVLTADNIIIGGRQLRRTKYSAPMNVVSDDSMYRCWSEFEDDCWAVDIFAVADNQGASEFVTLSVTIGLLDETMDPLTQPELKLVEGIVIGRTEFSDIPILPIGQPKIIDEAGVTRKLEWAIDGKELRHYLVLRYYGRKLLSFATWLNRSDSIHP